SAEGAVIPLARLKCHDEYTFTHSVNVGILASALGEAAGLYGDRLHDLTVSAFLHDIGKCGVEDTILKKPGRLSDEERQAMEVHPAFGAGLLLEQKDVPEIASIVAFEHHMRLDGNGYPHRKRPWKIHTVSQIVQIADVFDALRSDRPYRKAMTTADAVAVLHRLAGGAFDPELLRVFEQRVLARLDAEIAEDSADVDRGAA
ncbi:MAG: HD domain-containing phosphohydrolase, partial [Planctomycetota bacterium]